MPHSVNYYYFINKLHGVNVCCTLVKTFTSLWFFLDVAHKRDHNNGLSEVSQTKQVRLLNQY